MSADNSLTVSLEEFGLSKYEAKAYFAMLSKGPVSAGELAYYSEMPRTKVYPTLQKLQKKKLATVLGTKPIMCTAIDPDNAFDNIIQEQINKVNAMNSLVSNLKTVNEKSRKSRGIEECRYNHLSANNVLEELRILIGSAKKSVSMAINGLGVELISECKSHVVAALHRGVAVRMIVPPSEAGRERTGSLPACSEMRMLEQDQNMFVMDDADVMVAGKNGADVFSTTDVLAPSVGGIFDMLWKKAIAADMLLDRTSSESEDVYRAVTALDHKGLECALRARMQLDTLPDLAGLLEGNGVPVYSRTLKDLVDLADASLQAVCNGRAKIDGSEISLESPADHGHMPAWASVIDSYLRTNGYQTRIISHMLDNTEKIHIRLKKARPNMDRHL